MRGHGKPVATPKVTSEVLQIIPYLHDVCNDGRNGQYFKSETANMKDNLSLLLHSYHWLLLVAKQKKQALPIHLSTLTRMLIDPMHMSWKLRKLQPTRYISQSIGMGLIFHKAQEYPPLQIQIEKYELVP